MESSSRTRINAQIYDAASEWFVEFRSGDMDPAARERFLAWLRTSPEHVRAYLELAAIWDEGPAFDPDRQFDDEDLIGRAMQEANIHPLPVPPAAPSPSEAAEQSTTSNRSAHRKALRTSRAALAIAATILLTTGATIWYQFYRGVYATGIGEQHSVTLTDGSTIDLNARSRIQVHLTEQQRTVELLEGQALFRVAKDPTRPFVVRSGDSQIRAVGTQFDVYRKPSGTRVTVLEGRVTVTASSTHEPQAGGGRTEATPARPGELLVAGEQVIVTPRSTIRPQTPNIAAATAWTQRRIVFEETALAEVADEFNRYNRRQLVIDDERLRSFRVSGVFSSTDISALVRFLETRPDIVVTASGQEILISRR